MMSIDAVAAQRWQMWDAGFRPVAIYNPDVPGPSPGKRPVGNEWQHHARQDPPTAVAETPRFNALNTGILCDGLRAVDLDIDNLTTAHRCRSIALAMLGEAPIRTRRDSPRCLLVYRAAEGEPTKLTISGTLGKIEVLGRGQQFVAFGMHADGAALEWFPEPPGEGTRDALPAVTEEQIEAYLAACAPIIGAELLRKARNGHDTPGHEHTTSEPQADPLRIAVALASIPNSGPPDWERWNTIGMAIWRATGGSAAGWEAFNAWSQRNPAYDPAAARERWTHYPSSPPSAIGAGSLFHLANEARDNTVRAEYPEIPEPPESTTDAGYLASIDMEMSLETWRGVEARESGRAIPASKEARAAAGPNVLWSITEPWDMAAIPLRPWLARGYLMRGAVTVVSGPPSAGKSSLMVGWAVAMATGTSFHGLKITEPLRVMTYNAEDDEAEQKRRFSAVCIKMGLTPAAFGGNLVIVGPQHVGTLLHRERDGTVFVNTPVMDRLETMVDGFRPDVLMLDPFVELHNAEENDNTSIRNVVARFRGWAGAYNMSVPLLHHSRKGSNTPGDPESLRGASSIVGAARVVLTVNVMTQQEAARFGINDENRHRFYFRLDGAKNNYAPLHAAEWFERQEIRLPNAKGDQGDGVAVAWPWRPTKFWAALSPEKLNEALDQIDRGPGEGWRYGPTAKSDRWVGRPLIEVLEVNEEQAKEIIFMWKGTGLLRVEKYKGGSQRKEIAGVFVNNAKRPTVGASLDNQHD